MNYQLEERSCASCGKTFRVLSTSSQRYHSEECSYNIADQHLNPKQMMKRTWERESQSMFARLNHQTNYEKDPAKFRQNIKAAEKARELHGHKEIQKKQKSTPKSDTIKTETKDSLNEKDGEKKMKNGNAQPIDPTMPSTKSVCESKSTVTVIEPIQSVVSKKQLQIADSVLSQSMSLIDDTGKHLLDLMKGVTGHLDAEKVTTYDPVRVTAACNCANNLYQMMKAKIELIKLAKEINGG